MRFQWASDDRWSQHVRSGLGLRHTLCMTSQTEGRPRSEAKEGSFHEVTRVSHTMEPRARIFSRMNVGNSYEIPICKNLLYFSQQILRRILFKIARVRPGKQDYAPLIE